MNFTLSGEEKELIIKRRVKEFIAREVVLLKRGETTDLYEFLKPMVKEMIEKEIIKNNGAENLSEKLSSIILDVDT